MTQSVDLPLELYKQLRHEAFTLQIGVDTLLTGLVREFLEHQADIKNKNRRAYSRIKVEASALLHFRSDNGKSAMYKAGDLKDAAPGGVRIECDENFPVESLMASDRKFELIFQLEEDAPPLHLQCEVCRIDRRDGKTSLGVSFVGAQAGLAPEVLRFLAGQSSK